MSSGSFSAIIFCGPGSLLYPICDEESELEASSSSTSTSTSSSSKACLPILNLPLISFPLQSLLSSGIRRVTVLAKGSQHSEIMKSLSKVRLNEPSTSSSNSNNNNDLSTSSTSSQDVSNIQIVQHSNNLKDSSLTSTTLSPNHSILVDLIPLGPNDPIPNLSKRNPSNINNNNQKSNDRINDIDRSLGTAELLTWLAINGRVQATPLIMPLDFISPSFSLTTFLLNYHSNSLPNPPILQTLFYEKGYELKSGLSKEREKDLNPNVSENGGKNVLIGYESNSLSSFNNNYNNKGDSNDNSLGISNHSLRLIKPLNENSLELDLKNNLLKKSNRLKLNNNLLDSFIYILDLNKILNLLKSYPKITSLREHLIPFLIKSSWQIGLRDKVGWKFPEEENKNENQDLDEENGNHDGGLRRDSLINLENQIIDSSLNYREISSKKAGIIDLDLNNSVEDELKIKRKKKRDDTKGIKCLTTIVRYKVSNNLENSNSVGKKDQKKEEEDEESLVIRVNTLPAYLEVNRYFLTRLPTIKSFLPTLIPSNETTVPTSSTSTSETNSSTTTTATVPLISTSSHISNDSLIGEKVRIGDRSQIKRSVIGKSSNLDRNVKLMGCVVGERVVVGESSKLDICILASNSKIGEKCILKDCDVGPGAIVPSGTNAKGEKFSIEEDSLEDGGIEIDEE